MTNLQWVYCFFVICVFESQTYTMRYGYAPVYYLHAESITLSLPADSMITCGELLMQRLHDFQRRMQL
jgi:hypothetical protein